MVGFEDDYDLYFGGKKLDKGAFVAVSVLGNVNSEQSDKMSRRICELFEEYLGIPGGNVYVTYQGVRDWGHNGRNF